MVTLLVGPEGQRMTVHEENFPQGSQLSQAILKKERPEGQGQNHLIELPGESPTHMGYYIEHLYGGKPPTHVLTERSQSVTDAGIRYKLLAELYVLGGRMLDARYQNVIMREYFRLALLSDRYPGIGGVRIIYSGTTAQSPARRMMVDFAAGCPSDYWLKLAYEHTDGEFWYDLSKVMVRKTELHTLAGETRRMKVDDYLLKEHAELGGV